MSQTLVQSPSKNLHVKNHEINGNGTDCTSDNNNNGATPSSHNNNNNTSSNNNSSATTQQHQQLATTLVQYQGFGSFHSDNVEDLVRLPDSEYKRPALFPSWAMTYPSYSEIKFLEAYTDNIEAQDYPQDVGVAAKNGLSRLALGLPTRRCRGNNNSATTTSNNNNSNPNEDESEKIISFGEAVSRDHFYTDTDNWCFVNHGAFGGALRGGTLIKRRWEDFMEQQPLQFVDRTVLPSIVYCIRRLATFFNCRPQDLVPASNATLALNAAVNACVRHHTDVVAYLDLEYGSVWKMLREAWNWTRCTMHEIIMYPYLADPKIMGDDEEFTRVLESKLPAQLDVMVIDHVTSNSAMMLPVFTHIIPMLRRRGVSRIVVDGAHGALQFPLDFGSLREDQLPTYYAGNLHKWMCVPKSAAFMWVHPSMQHKTHSPIVTHGARAGMLSEFAWEGTKEYGAFLTIPSMLDFWERKCGVERVREYCMTLLKDADKLMCESFGVQPVPRGAPFMKLVPLPTFFNRKIFSAKFIQDTLHKVYRVEVPVKDLEGALYMRVSAFVYNDIHDYERVRDAVLKMRAVFRRKFASYVEAKHVKNGQNQQQSNASVGENGVVVSSLTLLSSLAELLAATNAVPTNDLGKPLPVDEFENNISQEEMNDASPFPFLQDVLEAFEMLERIQAEQQQQQQASSQDAAASNNNNNHHDNSRSRSKHSETNHNNNSEDAAAEANNTNNNNEKKENDSSSSSRESGMIMNGSTNNGTVSKDGGSFEISSLTPPATSHGNNNNSTGGSALPRSGNSSQNLDENSQREARDLASLLVGKKPCPDSSKSGGCGVGGINTMITTAFSDTSSDDDE